MDPHRIGSQDWGDGAQTIYRALGARTGEAGHTFTPTNPLVAENKRAVDRCRRIDYVFVRCDDSLHGPTLDVRACTLAFDEPVGGVWASDHFGVVAELSVPDVCFCADRVGNAGEAAASDVLVGEFAEAVISPTAVAI